MIGIAGPSCAGKSELAHGLAKILASPIVSLDSYYRDQAHLPFEQRQRTNYDVPGALDKELLISHFGLLAEGAEVHIPVYDFTRHTRAAEVHRVRAGEYAIVEGLFTLYWEEIRTLLHTKVFIGAADEVCFSRRLERDVHERGRTPESVLEQYRAAVRPMAEQYILPTRRFADVVLDGTAPIERSVAAVFAWIQLSRVSG